MGLTWHGERIKARVRDAARGAIQETNEGAAREASGLWPVDTGLSAESIDVIREASSDGPVTSGSWGGKPLPPSSEYTPSSRFRVFWTEVGVEGRPGLNILRRTFDAWNGGLVGRIRGRLR